MAQLGSGEAPPLLAGDPLGGVFSVPDLSSSALVAVCDLVDAWRDVPDV